MGRYDREIAQLHTKFNECYYEMYKLVMLGGLILQSAEHIETVLEQNLNKLNLTKETLDVIDAKLLDIKAHTAEIYKKEKPYGVEPESRTTL